MSFVLFEFSSLLPGLLHHLWQSTIFCLLIAALSFALKRNEAKVRFRLWLLASLKFLIPFALLVSVGEHLKPVAKVSLMEPAFSMVMEGAVQPEPLPVATAGVSAVGQDHPLRKATDVKAIALKLLPVIWLIGSIALAAVWFYRWRSLWKIVRAGTRLPSGDLDMPVLSTSARLEPGVFGIVKPVLLLPEEIWDRLTARQMDAIIAHELCHVRRRDNLSAAIHSVVQVLFWFHPAVWWIGARMVEEREAACDAAVLTQSTHEAMEYAESILKICRLYTEPAMEGFAGVTGADLKQRVLRIAGGHFGHKLSAGHIVLLAIAGGICIGAPLSYGTLHPAAVHAAAQAAKNNIDDTWQGTLHADRDLRSILKITKAPDGTLKGMLYSIDQGGQGIAAKTTTFTGDTLKLSFDPLDITYEAKLSPDGTTLTGTVLQGDHSKPLILVRATLETAWTIPAPPPKLPPMDPKADPTFEVATIKPTDPNAKGKYFRVMGRRFTTLNTTLSELIEFSYGVQLKQIVGGPAWMETEHFDLSAQPDLQGAPSDAQWKSMVKKLLADRFQLRFHQDKRELSAYVLTVASGGPKMTKNNDNPNGLPGLFFTKVGTLQVTNANMTDFSRLMESAVFDRPVVNQTGLEGRWNFLLKWTPDETQFIGGPEKVPPPSDDPNAPPPIFKAIQEQIGLKLDATRAQVDVMVVDNVAKPSEN